MKPLRVGLPALLLLWAAGARAGDVAAVIQGNTRAAVDLYARLCGQEGNLFLAPYSISTALTLTSAGARGATAEQMARALHLALPPERLHPAFATLIREVNSGPRDGWRLGAALARPAGFRLCTANALWGQKGTLFRDDFLRLAQNHYGAGLGVVDFRAAPDEARRVINAWAAKKTQGQIPDLLPADALSPATRLVLTNAIYFKGDWASRFPKAATRTEAFHTGGGRQAPAPLMRQTAEFGYHDGGTFQALELPYAGRQLSMVVLLPRRADGLAGLEKALSADLLAGVFAGLRKQTVDVTLPRFQVAARFRLKETLSALGMASAFSPGADFSGMISSPEPLALADVFHQARVEVNEEGTEAAAATAVEVHALSLPPQPTVFRADHPFLFLVRENRTGTILFLGRLADPR
jgi:serpin B